MSEIEKRCAHRDIGNPFLFRNTMSRRGLIKRKGEKERREFRVAYLDRSPKIEVPILIGISLDRGAKKRAAFLASPSPSPSNRGPVAR